MRLIDYRTEGASGAERLRRGGEISYREEVVVGGELSLLLCGILVLVAIGSPSCFCPPRD